MRRLYPCRPAVQTWRMVTDTAKTPTNSVVRLDLAGSRYVIEVDGKPAGFTSFADRDEHRVFVHAEIAEGHAGQGLGGVLVSNALADVRRRNLRVISLCPFVSGYLQRHHDFDDILDPATPALMAELGIPA